MAEDMEIRREMTQLKIKSKNNKDVKDFLLKALNRVEEGERLRGNYSDFPA